MIEVVQAFDRKRLRSLPSDDEVARERALSTAARRLADRRRWLQKSAWILVNDPTAFSNGLDAVDREACIRVRNWWHSVHHEGDDHGQEAGPQKLIVSSALRRSGR